MRPLTRLAPTRALLALVALLASTACGPRATTRERATSVDAASSSDSAAPIVEGAVAVSRLRAEPYSFAYSSGFTAPARIVATDTAAWREAWTQLHARGGPLPPLPAVDFTRQAVIVAALGQRATGGYGIIVEDAAVARDTLRVTVRSISPGPRCGTTSALSQPVDVALLPRLRVPIAFVERDSVTLCP